MPTSSPSKSWFTKIAPPTWLIIIFLLVILLRLPSLFEPFRYDDENIYLTLGNALKRGLVFYRDIHDNKPPLIYLLAALAGNVFWFHFILLIANLVTIYFFHRLAKVFFPQKTRLVQFATVIFTLTSSLPTLEGNIANSEIFMIGPTIIAFYLILSLKSRLRYLLAGICFALALLFKVPAAIDAFAFIFLWLADLKLNRPESIKSWLTQNLLLATGILLPVALTCLYFAAQHALQPYLTAAFLQNFGYLSTWQSATPATSFWARNSSLLARLATTLLATLILLTLKAKKILSPSSTLLLLWLTWSTFAVFLSQRPYPHYLIQVLPPFSLATAWLIFDKSPQKLLALPLLALLATGTVYFHFYYPPTYPYYANFAKMVTRQISRDQYLATFGAKYPSRYQLAQFLTTATNENDKIFVWGTDPEIYALTRRLPTGRYTVSYHIIDYHGQAETLTALRTTPPKYIVVTATESRPWPEFFQFLRLNYFPLSTFGDATIYWHPTLSPKNSQ